ncbi:MAG: cytochrome-c oxidase, cbb3-type subunit III [Rhodocyclaceae bacterium]|nr:cytochrome-c oxidase, cbb3-type subunit III [Rhodocyclaceae bacterium]
MSDFVNGFWNMYVMVLVALSLVYCLFVLMSNRTEKKVGGVQLHGNVWDENIQEWNNPLPGWWMGLFWLTVLFGIAYLAMYPGFGSFKGAFGWTSLGQYEDEMKKAAEKYDPIFNKFLTQDIKVVAADPEAKAMGERLFQTYCSQCHGSDAKGAKGFPNLTDSDWLYGGEPEQIETTIKGGRQGMMPPFAHLGADTIKDAANYVRSLSGMAADSTRAQRGKEVFMANCSPCHGQDAKGNTAIGAPNLSDSTWLYGSSEGTVTETITMGRQNRMPAFQEFLGDAKIHLLAAYIYGKSAGAAPKAETK